MRTNGSRLSALKICRHPTEGTETHLHVLQLFFWVFNSEHDTLEERTINCAYIVAFLKIWRHDAHCHPDRNPKENFLTCQRFDHMLLFCCQAVMLILTFRDCGKNEDGVAGQTPCTGLAKTGSDCCEMRFSTCGGVWCILLLVRHL